jgi:hypothetical protein
MTFFIIRFSAPSHFALLHSPRLASPRITSPHLASHDMRLTTGANIEQDRERGAKRRR